MIQTKHAPALPGHVSCVASLRQAKPLLQGVAGCDDDSGLQLWSSAGCCSSLLSVPTQAAEVSLSSSPTSGLQALKDKRFESKLASEACYSRGGILALQR